MFPYNGRILDIGGNNSLEIKMRRKGESLPIPNLVEYWV